MNDTIIKLKTAKLAKEKNFNIPIKALYYWDYEYFKTKLSLTPISEYDNINRNEDDDTRYSAPTQSLLQKWLREKHNIHVEVNVNSLIGFKVSTFKMGAKAYEIVHPTADETANKIILKSYEEALEIGLKDGLNLID